MQHALTLEGITKSYGDVLALAPTDLEIRAGEFITLLGPSGSGKTTLLMAVAGFVQPSAGRMLLDGREITAMPPEARNFGVVFQGYALFPHLSVWENVYFPLRARNLSRSQARAAVAEAIDLMELGPYAQRMPRALSGGQQQRVALARALVFKPELLLLDEPLSALDKALRKSLQTELKALHRKVGTTFVYVTHDQEEALSMSDRIAILRDGQIQQIAPPADLYTRPRNRFVAGFLGRSNFLDGRVTGHDGGQAVVDTPLGQFRAVVDPLPAPGAHVCLAIRPEALSVTPEEPALANRVQGAVADVTYLGADREVTLRVGDRLVEAVMRAGAPGLAEGAPVWAGWAAEQTRVLPAEETAP